MINSEIQDCYGAPTAHRILNFDDFFDNIENFRPLRGGRRAETLSQVAISAATIEKAEQKFLDCYANSKTQDDPLKQMWDYTCWFEEHFPSGKQKYFFPILYKICTEFSAMDRYKNDERIMKLWFKLSENFPESGLAVMEFAFHSGSCRTLSKFYIRWSEMYQDLGWYTRSREKLQLGVKMCAAPLHLLHMAIDELEAVILRNAKDNDDEDFSVREDDNRCALGALRAIGRKHHPPVIRTPYGPPGTVRLHDETPFGRKDKRANFRVFADKDEGRKLQRMSETPPADVCGITIKRSRVAMEFSGDPNYQALFGFYEPPPEKIGLDFTNKENVPTGARTKLSLHREISKPSNAVLVASAFKVFVDEGTNGSPVPLQRVKPVDKIKHGKPMEVWESKKY